MGDSKIRISAFLEKEILDRSLDLKKRYEKIAGIRLRGDSPWFALLISDGLPIRTQLIEQMENRRQ